MFIIQWIGRLIDNASTRSVFLPMNSKKLIEINSDLMYTIRGVCLIGIVHDFALAEFKTCRAMSDHHNESFPEKEVDRVQVNCPT